MKITLSCWEVRWFELSGVNCTIRLSSKRGGWFYFFYYCCYIISTSQYSKQMFKETKYFTKGKSWKKSILGKNASMILCDLVRCSNYWATGDCELLWARLKLWVSTGSASHGCTATYWLAHMNSLTASDCHIKACSTYELTKSITLSH